ncbi:MAG: Acetylglutamate kinase [uncultured Sphingomonadaceae bacterium]|uniref:Acetylglutamate kinase n=1 Tax=uncultured Sphingomonadaceae bacterium TaxID=169976 RepID=A0A6J4T206_9SPHN|nr:MAG: Acetylglutamate kinase [uncultured Sphingomonadaceae bacterium]
MDDPARDTSFAPTLLDLEQLARRALLRLPAPFAGLLDGVLLRVEEFADEETLDSMGIEDPFELTGLYSGRPIGEPAATGDPPPTIHLYRRPLLDEWCDTGVGLERLITHVVVHEIGHHFGLSDDDMHRLEEAG